MKKIIMLIILIMTIISCTAEDKMAWENVKRKEQERGVRCTYNHKGEVISCNYGK